MRQYQEVDRLIEGKDIPREAPVTPEDQFFDKCASNPKLNAFISVIFTDAEINIYLDRIGNTTVRNLATKYHMSRFNIRRTLSKTYKKIEGLRILLIGLAK